MSGYYTSLTTITSTLAGEGTLESEHCRCLCSVAMPALLPMLPRRICITAQPE